MTTIKNMSEFYNAIDADTVIDAHNEKDLVSVIDSISFDDFPEIVKEVIKEEVIHIDDVKHEIFVFINKIFNNMRRVDDLEDATNDNCKHTLSDHRYITKDEYKTMLKNYVLLLFCQRYGSNGADNVCCLDSIQLKAALEFAKYCIKDCNNNTVKNKLSFCIKNIIEEIEYRKIAPVMMI